MEPPTMVINTILSVMSYNYPPEKLSVYLSDDGGSDFSRHWIPFCKKFNVKPMSPSAYFAQQIDLQDITYAQEWLAIKIKRFLNASTFTSVSHNMYVKLHVESGFARSGLDMTRFRSI
ncbi:cellulose synthase-like protein E6 [Fagus crenata]